MEDKYWYGVSFCYPEGNILALGKFAIKVALTAAGTPAVGLVSEGIALLYKPLFGGLPIESVLTITDNYFEFKPSKLATFFADGIEMFHIPKREIISVEKSFNFLIMQHVLKIQLRTTEIKFFINPTSISVGKIVSSFKMLSR